MDKDDKSKSDLSIDSNENKYWNDEIINKYLDFTKTYYLNNWPEKYKGWVTNYKFNKKKLHYTCAIFKKDLVKIDYFTESYKDLDGSRYTIFNENE